MTTLQLDGRNIDSSSISCTVAQIILVFEALTGYGATAELVWFGADIDPPVPPYSSSIPRRLGSIDAVVDFLRAFPFPQCGFGVFVGMPHGIAVELLAEHVSAEGSPRRRVIDAVLEVVAFDDTFIEITTNDGNIIRALRDRFGGRTLP